MKKTHPLLVGIDDVKPYSTVAGEKLYDIRPPAMQIADFLPVGGVMGITSYPGAGKTWVALEVSRAVSSGKPFLDRFPTMRGGVLFVGSDSSLYDYARQWTRLTKRYADREQFEPVRFLVQSTFMFEDRDEVRRLIASHRKFEWGETTYEPGTNLPHREGGFHVIVFDTVSRLTRANQNDNTEMEEVFRNIRWIAEATDAAIILLHHNAKKSEFNDGSDWRGAMSQIGALDSWVQLTPSRKDKYLVGMHFKKFRGITPQDFSFRLNVTDPEQASLTATDDPVTLAQRMQFNPLNDAIDEWLTQHPGSRARDMRDGLWERFHDGVQGAGREVMQFEEKRKFYSAIQNRLKALSDVGRVRREGLRDKARYYRAEDQDAAKR